MEYSLQALCMAATKVACQIKTNTLHHPSIPFNVIYSVVTRLLMTHPYHTCTPLLFEIVCRNDTYNMYTYVTGDVCDRYTHTVECRGGCCSYGTQIGQTDIRGRHQGGMSNKSWPSHERLSMEYSLQVLCMAATKVACQIEATTLHHLSIASKYIKQQSHVLAHDTSIPYLHPAPFRDCVSKRHI